MRTREQLEQRISEVKAELDIIRKTDQTYREDELKERLLQELFDLEEKLLQELLELEERLLQELQDVRDELYVLDRREEEEARELGAFSGGEARH